MSKVLEQGDVFFFYRPRVGVQEVRGLADVQRFFVVLKPDRTARFRRLIVGRKRLPDPRSHEREWAFVVEVADDVAALSDELASGVRAVGEGRYAIADHDGHTHLAYALELPHELGEPQRELNIRREASYIIAVRNPEAPAPPGVGLDDRRRAELPRDLAQRFGGRRFAPLDPPDFLDYVGAEIVLIGATEDASRELGIELDGEAERLEDADLVQALHMAPYGLVTEPMRTGQLR